MSSEERIAKALEERNEIVMGILYGLLVALIIIGALMIIMMFGQTVYDFLNYNILNNERPPSPVYAIEASKPIYDCNYSQDEQLCYQMKRIADVIEQQNTEKVIEE